MCFGGGSTTQTVTQVPQPKTPEEQEAIRLALQSLQMRQALLPFILQEAGFGIGGGSTPSPPPPGPPTSPLPLPGSTPPASMTPPFPPTPPGGTSYPRFPQMGSMTTPPEPPGSNIPPLPPTSPGSPGGAFNLFRLPPTANQQALSMLTGSSLGGANEAVQMLLQRLRASQGLIPGLVQSVRATMPQGWR